MMTAVLVETLSLFTLPAEHFGRFINVFFCLLKK